MFSEPAGYGGVSRIAFLDYIGALNFLCNDQSWFWNVVAVVVAQCEVVKDFVIESAK